MAGEEEKKEEGKEEKKEEDKGPNGCMVCLQATWDVVYVSSYLLTRFSRRSIPELNLL
jgi:hypothetical protein